MLVGDNSNKCGKDLLAQDDGAGEDYQLIDLI
jgi:hypothetical protein